MRKIVGIADKLFSHKTIISFSIDGFHPIYKLYFSLDHINDFQDLLFDGGLIVVDLR